MTTKRPIPKLASIDELLLLSEQPQETSDQKDGIQLIPINKIFASEDRLESPTLNLGVWQNHYLRG
ncbi:hypothetical protein D3C76_196540 [compost metagenome]